MKASLSHYQQSPRKVRLLADLVRGKKVEEAITLLSFADKRASLPIKKLIESAAANAVINFNTPKEELVVSEIRVDKGRVLKRSMPRARGSAFIIRRRSSHVQVTLGRPGEKKEKVKEVLPVAPEASAKKKEAKVSVKKPTTRTKKAKTE